MQWAVGSGKRAGPAGRGARARVGGQPWAAAQSGVAGPSHDGSSQPLWVLGQAPVSATRVSGEAIITSTPQHHRRCCTTEPLQPILSECAQPSDGLVAVASMSVILCTGKIPSLVSDCLPANRLRMLIDELKTAGYDHTIRYALTGRLAQHPPLSFLC